jgi:hypothetical protein
VKKKRWSARQRIALIVVGIAGWWANLPFAHPDARWLVIALSSFVTVVGAVLIAANLLASRREQSERFAEQRKREHDGTA